MRRDAGVRIPGRHQRLAALLALCGYLATHGLELPAALLLALAMGAENTIFAEGGEVRLGLTYMTGALVKIGKGIASTLFREEPYLWAPHLLLWLGLVAGGALGAALYNQLGATALWFAAGAVALMAPASLTIFPRREDQPSQPENFCLKRQFFHEAKNLARCGG